MRIQLKGLPAITAAVVALAGFIGYRAFLHSSLPEDPKVRRELESCLMPELAGDISTDAEAIKKAIKKGDKAEASRLAEGLLTRKVEIQNLAMRGSGDDIIVKVTYAVHGPQGPQTHLGYYRFSYSIITGWHLRREVSSFSWYSKLF